MRKFPMIPIAVGAMLLVSAAGLAAQKVAPGARVRVTSATLGHNPTVCRVLAVGADTLTLAAGAKAAPFAVSLAQVGKLEVSRGWKSKAGKYAAIGGLAGAVLGAAGGSAAGSGEPCNDGG